VGRGLVAKGVAGQRLEGFTIAGADRRFLPASAAIQKGRVVVWSDLVPEPIAVRYAWADNPERANLFNLEGLPASPFRTDSW
jgi:sialate O-acetylesterase